MWPKANDDSEKGPQAYEQQIWLMIYDDVEFYSLSHEMPSTYVPNEETKQRKKDSKVDPPTSNIKKLLGKEDDSSVVEDVRLFAIVDDGWK